MLNDFVIKERTDIPTKEIHISSKDRGLDIRLHNLDEDLYKALNRNRNQQRIIDSLKEQIYTQSQLLDTKIKTINLLEEQIHDLNLKLIPKKV